jgi:hypothetical protein
VYQDTKLGRGVRLSASAATQCNVEVPGSRRRPEDRLGASPPLRVAGATLADIGRPSHHVSEKSDVTEQTASDRQVGSDMGCRPSVASQLGHVSESEGACDVDVCRGDWRLESHPLKPHGGGLLLVACHWATIVAADLGRGPCMRRPGRRGPWRSGWSASNGVRIWEVFEVNQLQQRHGEHPLARHVRDPQGQRTIRGSKQCVLVGLECQSGRPRSGG